MNQNQYTYTLTYNFDGDRHWIMGTERAVLEEVYARACLYRPDQFNWRIIRSDGIQIAHHDVIDVKANLWKRTRVNALIIERISCAAEREYLALREDCRAAQLDVLHDRATLSMLLSRLDRREAYINLIGTINQVVLS